jgi:hypothetical protein
LSSRTPTWKRGRRQIQQPRRPSRSSLDDFGVGELLILKSQLRTGLAGAASTSSAMVAITIRYAGMKLPRASEIVRPSSGEQAALHIRELIFEGRF